MTPRMRALALLALALCGFAGCELAEVTTPGGRDLLVVEGVLRAGNHRQVILLHRTLLGSTIRGESGARVAILRPDGTEMLLVEDPAESCADNLGSFLDEGLTVQATCYSARFAVLPGATYELRITTEDDLVLRGRTTVPGDFDLSVPALPRNAACVLPPGVNLPLTWSQSSGAWAYFGRIGVSGLPAAFAGTGIEAPEYLQLTGLAISQSDTTMSLPSDFGLFDRFDADLDLLIALQLGFPAGVRVDLALSAADRNYVNGVRGGAFNPSGNVRISSVVGDGVGMFGSTVIRRLVVEVGGTAPLPPCLP
jgi:hypothetical protein